MHQPEYMETEREMEMEMRTEETAGRPPSALALSPAAQPVSSARIETLARAGGDLSAPTLMSPGLQRGDFVRPASLLPEDYDAPPAMQIPQDFDSFRLPPTVATSETQKRSRSMAFDKHDSGAAGDSGKSAPRSQKRRKQVRFSADLSHQGGELGGVSLLHGAGASSGGGASLFRGEGERSRSSFFNQFDGPRGMPPARTGLAMLIRDAHERPSLHQPSMLVGGGLRGDPGAPREVPSVSEDHESASAPYVPEMHQLGLSDEQDNEPRVETPHPVGVTPAREAELEAALLRRFEAQLGLHGDTTT